MCQQQHAPTSRKQARVRNVKAEQARAGGVTHPCLSRGESVPTTACPASLKSAQNMETVSARNSDLGRLRQHSQTVKRFSIQRDRVKASKCCETKTKANKSEAESDSGTKVQLTNAENTPSFLPPCCIRHPPQQRWPSAVRSPSQQER